MPVLASAFVGFAARRMGWDVDPDQVVLATDVMVAVASLCRGLSEPGGMVAFASPNYPPFFDELPREGVRLREVSLGPDGGLDLAALRVALADGARVLVLTSPHNPTGRVFPRPELQALTEAPQRHTAHWDRPVSSEAAPSETLVVTMGAVEKHVANIFSKLDLPANDDQRHRRVAAVVQYVGS